MQSPSSSSSSEGSVGSSAGLLIFVVGHHSTKRGVARVTGVDVSDFLRWVLRWLSEVGDSRCKQQGAPSHLNLLRMKSISGLCLPSTVIPSIRLACLAW